MFALKTTTLLFAGSKMSDIDLSECRLLVDSHHGDCDHGVNHSGDGHHGNHPQKESYQQETLVDVVSDFNTISRNELSALPQDNDCCEQVVVDDTNDAESCNENDDFKLSKHAISAFSQGNESRELLVNDTNDTESCNGSGSDEGFTKCGESKLMNENRNCSNSNQNLTTFMDSINKRRHSDPQYDSDRLLHNESISDVNSPTEGSTCCPSPMRRQSRRSYKLFTEQYLDQDEHEHNGSPDFYPARKGLLPKKFQAPRRQTVCSAMTTEEVRHRQPCLITCCSRQFSWPRHLTWSKCCEQKDKSDEEDDLDIPYEDEPFRKRCSRACFTFVYILLATVAVVVTYSMIQDLINSMNNPVRSVHYKKVTDYEAPGMYYAS